jgi:fatty-acid peroxygenase
LLSSSRRYPGLGTLRTASDFPRTAWPDSTLALLREGYGFIGRRCRRYGGDAFRTRIMLHDVVCMTGAEAAEMFYRGGHFSRADAMPVTVLKLLQDRGSVQALEDAAHRHRKQLFLSLTTGAEVERLREHFAAAWRRRQTGWRLREYVVLYDEAFDILTDAACAWAGVSLEAEAVHPLSGALRAMIEGAGSIGPRNWRALALRHSAERWAQERVRDARRNGGTGERSPIGRLAHHKGCDGKLLPEAVAAVELLNLLRPIAATAVYVTFAAMALHQHPQWRAAFARGEEDELGGFVQEVRRLAPFFPMIGGRARQAIEWRGRPIEAGQWVLLDLYDSCRDPRAWNAPETFYPGRHRSGDLEVPGLVPQGAGDHLESHRCPGEWMVVALMKDAVRLLCRDTEYRVPAQELSVRRNRMPGRPESGFVMTDVR